MKRNGNSQSRFIGMVLRNNYIADVSSGASELAGIWLKHMSECNASNRDVRGYRSSRRIVDDGRAVTGLVWKPDQALKSGFRRKWAI
jgi:hypothetical protein